jgi:hypothetical protein
LIILLSTGAGALMAGDLRTAGERLTLHSQASTQPTSKGKNAYLWPGVALMAVGAGLIVYGLQAPDGPAYLCPAYQTCRGPAHRDTEIAVEGGVAAAAGLTLLIVGEGKKRSAPFIVIRPKSVGFGYRLTF